MGLDAIALDDNMKGRFVGWLEGDCIMKRKSLLGKFPLAAAARNGGAISSTMLLMRETQMATES